MERKEPTEATLQQLRDQFPVSLIGSWSTFGDGYQMDYGQTATFHADGSGMFEMWDTSDDEEPVRQLPFRWEAKGEFEVEVKPMSEKSCPDDWGSFLVEFFLSEDAYGTKSVAIRDARASNGQEAFWWFLKPDEHPMRLLKPHNSAA